MNETQIQKVKFATLGCRLNQYETQAIREQFKQAGYEETEHSSEADVFILNTCTVTNESDKENRYQIRKFHRENPNAKIIVTGCYVEKNEGEIKNLPGVSLTVLNRQKSEILNLMESCATFELPSKRAYTPLVISEFEGKTRAYIKIQDGCNHACSFCKVVLVRGASRSRQMGDIIEEAKRLSERGFQEIVLTGIQLGAYGHDLAKHQMLPELIRKLSEISEIKRIRLSSIEPTDVTDELIEIMAANEKICRHLHVPLQSGSDFILERMNRRYRRQFYLDLISKIKSRIPDFILTTDVMTGFPGETDYEFQETVDLLNQTEPYKLHIFPYSVREGTRAARFTDLIESSELKKRRAFLLDLENKLKNQIQNRYLNKTTDLLIEEPNGPDWSNGRLGNYIQVHFPGNAKAGSFRKIKIEQIRDNQLIGEAIS